ncbi:hypothetical protein DFH09DRAFT_1088837 [Mycena vulgaris]|nr:hypothetical protein DFH09DRAFT_1088837 [Mycena vulgaris]
MAGLTERSTAFYSSGSHRYEPSGAELECSGGACSAERKIAPAVRDIDLHRQLRKRCTCGEELQLRQSGTEANTHFYRGGAYFTNAGAHSHSQFTHTLIYRPNETFEFAEYMSKRPIALNDSPEPEARRDLRYHASSLLELTDRLDAALQATFENLLEFDARFYLSSPAFVAVADYLRTSVFTGTSLVLLRTLPHPPLHFPIDVAAKSDERISRKLCTPTPSPKIIQCPPIPRHLWPNLSLPPNMRQSQTTAIPGVAALTLQIITIQLRSDRRHRQTTATAAINGVVTVRANDHTPSSLPLSNHRLQPQAVNHDDEACSSPAHTPLSLMSVPTSTSTSAYTPTPPPLPPFTPKPPPTPTPTPIHAYSRSRAYAYPSPSAHIAAFLTPARPPLAPRASPFTSPALYSAPDLRTCSHVAVLIPAMSSSRASSSRAVTARDFTTVSGGLTRSGLLS